MKKTWAQMGKTDQHVQMPGGRDGAGGRGGGTLWGLEGSCLVLWRRLSDLGGLCAEEERDLSLPTASAQCCGHGPERLEGRAFLQVGRPGAAPKVWLLSPQSGSPGGFLGLSEDRAGEPGPPGLLLCELGPSFGPQLLTRTLAWGPWGGRGGVVTRRAGRAGRASFWELCGGSHC